MAIFGSLFGKAEVPKSVSMKPVTAAQVKGKSCFICKHPFPPASNSQSEKAKAISEKTHCTNSIMFTTTFCKCKNTAGKVCVTDWFKDKNKQMCPICRTSTTTPAPKPKDRHDKDWGGEDPAREPPIFEGTFTGYTDGIGALM